MNCHATRAALNALVDGEWSVGVAVLAEAARHVIACRECRAVWRSLLRQRRLAQRLSSGAPPAHLREGVLGRLDTATNPGWDAATRSAPSVGRPAASGRKGWALKLAAAAALVVFVGALGVYTTRPGRAENTPAALARVNTWHLSGWKTDPAGARVTWEVWGRRKPFLYREQIGQQVLLDDGQARLHLLPLGPGRQLAVRTRSLQTLDDARWTRLTVGTDWKDAEPFRSEQDQVIYQWTDSGMQGPGSVSHDYFFVDRSTWLPTRWEYREGRGKKETTVSSLDVEYDVPVPDGMDSARPPADAQVVDALAAPDKPLPVKNTESAGGVTAQATPFKLDAAGNILVRVRAWLGSATLGGDSLSFFSGLPIWARSVDGQRHPWAITDDQGRPYVVVNGLASGRAMDVLEDGTQKHWIAPLEPLPPGEPLPRALTLNLTISPAAMLEGRSHNLLHQDLRWSVALPAPGAPLTLEDYMAPPAQRNVRYLEEVPLAASIASSRSLAYECQSDYPGAIRWMAAAIRECRPDSNQAQFLRLGLANLYRRNKDRARFEATLQEVIESKKRYPKTWDYYAQNARLTLRIFPRNKK